MTGPHEHRPVEDAEVPRDDDPAPGSGQGPDPDPGPDRGPDAETFGRLLDVATSFAARAYAPYSRYRVGAAALVDDGRVVGGCNVENAGYGVTLCAECGLISDLVAGGGGRLTHFVCVDGDGGVIMPCGRCRQLLSEHADPALVVLTPRGPARMDEVLPQAFGPADLA